MLFDTIFLIGAFQSIFLAFIFLYQRKSNLANKLLIAWLLLIGVHLLFVYFGFSGFYKKYPQLIIFGSSLMLLEGPFLFLYTASATSKIKKLKLQHLLHFIPFVFCFSFVAYTIGSFSGPNLYDKISIFFNSTTNVFVLAFGILNHVHIIIYLLFSILILREHTNQLPNNFSFTEDIDLKWLKNLIIGITAIAFVILIGFLINDVFSIADHKFKASIVYIAFAILPFYMSFYAIRNKIVYSDQRSELHSAKYESSGLSKEISKEIATRLSRFMESDKPHLNPKLTMKELAIELDVHPKQLSQVINENFDQNFFNFINKYRVAEFKRKLKDSKNDNYTLIAIAYDCGFNTKSSFYSIFKKLTGVTPSSYKSKVKG